MPVNRAGWLVPPEPPAQGKSRRDKALLDLLPTGILIYRLDRLLYANPAFLTRMGYESLHALEHAGGLDALYVESMVSTASSTSENGTAVTISAAQESLEHAQPSAIDARPLYDFMGRRCGAGLDFFRCERGGRRGSCSRRQAIRR